MFIVKSGFIGEFANGDNINHNLRILEILYMIFDESKEYEQKHLCKPIIMILMSIIDSIIYDLFKRIKYNVYEGVNNIPELMKKDIKEKTYNNFSNRLALCKKYNLFDFKSYKSEKFHNIIDNLVKLRNRIHIQNEKGHSPKSEYKAFNIGRKEEAELICEYILKISYKKFARKPELHRVKHFKCCWKERINNL